MLNYYSPALIVVIIAIVITFALSKAFLKFAIAQFAHRALSCYKDKKNLNMCTIGVLTDVFLSRKWTNRLYGQIIRSASF